MRRLALAAVGLFAVAVAFALTGTPLTATFLTDSGYGVHDDGNPLYSNAISRVKCYFAGNGGNVDLVTYNTGRKLVLQFDPASSAWQSSGLAPTLAAEVDLYGVNFYGPFASMNVGTTAQVQTSLQFKSGNSTYELAYPALAAKRLDSSTWLITSDPADIGGDPGFTASAAADLGVFRKRSRADFGGVTMPVRFQVQLK